MTGGPFTSWFEQGALIFFQGLNTLSFTNSVNRQRKKAAASSPGPESCFAAALAEVRFGHHLERFAGGSAQTKQ